MRKDQQLNAIKPYAIYRPFLLPTLPVLPPAVTTDGSGEDEDGGGGGGMAVGIDGDGGGPVVGVLEGSLVSALVLVLCNDDWTDGVAPGGGDG